MSKYSRETVEQTVIDIVGDLIQDWGLDLEEALSGKTLLVEDLEFASVDIIQLCVAIEQHYEQKLGFQDLLMKEGHYVSDLTLDQIIDYVYRKLAGTEL